MTKKKTIKDYEDDIKLFERYFKIDDLCESYKSYRSAKNQLKKKGISNKRKNKLEKILKETAENHRTYKKYDNLINRMKKKQRKIATSTPPPPPPQPSQHQQPLLSHQPSVSSQTVSPQQDDDSSTLFDADTIVPDDVPSFVPDEVPSSVISSSSSPQSFTSELLRRIK